MPSTFNNPRLIERRRELRKNATLPEHILWGYLRNKRLYGLKFWRQYSIGPYIVDFYCPKYRLAIEVDGDSHFLPGAQEYDAKRQQFIESFNITVIRFLNTDVRYSIDAVLSIIQDVALELHHPQPPVQ